MSKHNVFWTEEELAYLHNDELTVQEIADKLGRSYASVSAKKHVLARDAGTINHHSNAKKNRVDYIPDDTDKVINLNIKNGYVIKQEDCLKLYETVPIGTKVNILLMAVNDYHNMAPNRKTTGIIIDKYPFFAKVRITSTETRCIQWSDIGRMNLHLLP